MAEISKQLSEHTWKKGQSGNPNGRPTKHKPFRDALMVALNDKIKTANGDKRKLRIVAESLVKEAIDGNVGAISLISDRLDGKAKVEAELLTHHSGEPIKAITLNIIDPNKEEEKTQHKVIEHEP
jgi:hypothetical protein